MTAINTDKLAALIRRAGKNYSQIALAVGIPPSMMTKIMRGWKDPSLAVAARMAKELDCTVDDLISK